MAWSALHQGKGTAHVILDSAQFLLVAAPCQHIEMRTDGGQALRMGDVEILLYPLLVDLIATAVPCQRVHVPCLLFEAFKIGVAVLDEDVLVIDMVAGQHQAHGSGKGQTAVASVGGEPFIPAVRTDRSRQVVRVRERMQTKHIVAHTHKVGTQTDVLQRGVSFFREGEITVKQTAFFLCAYQFFFRHAGNPYLFGVIDDTLELIDGFHELHHLVPVGDFLGNEMSAAERGKIALLCHTLPVGLGQEQVNAVMQVGAFVEMPFRCTGKETQTAASELALIVFLNKPVLFMHDAVIGQHLDGLVPCRVHRLVFCGGDGKEFGQFHAESHRDVRILAHHAPLLDGEQRKLRFQGRYLTVVSHSSFFWVEGYV